MNEVFFVVGVLVFLVNIAPFIYSDVFGHYYRVHTKYFAESEESGDGSVKIYVSSAGKPVKEKCNPWIAWWGLLKYTKIKGNTFEIEFDSEDTRSLLENSGIEKWWEYSFLRLKKEN